jgi:ribokinase
VTILVAGLVNIETSLPVEGFPIPYQPARYPFFGIESRVSGVGYNLARALTTLGHPVRLVSLIGQDLAGGLVAATLDEGCIGREWVLPRLARTPQSVVLVAPDGQRQVNTDLKDIQEQTYPPADWAAGQADCLLLVLTIINVTRPGVAADRASGRPVATDVHVIGDLDDPYNRDYMAAATILFQSHERLPLPPEDWARAVLDRYPVEILVIGLGAEGALLAVRRDGWMGRLPAAVTRPVVSTVGAGDALFASFLHGYHATGDPYEALRKAIVFASYKIGEAGGARGFLTAPALDALAAQRG